MPTQGMNSINNSSSDEHEELLAEMELIERLPTQERLKQAKRRRALQLKKWLDFDREYEMRETNHITSTSEVYFDERRANSTRSSSSGKKSRDTISSTTLVAAVTNQTKRRGIRFQDHVVLLDAIMRKDYREVERLLEEVGVTPNSANEDGLTAIHQCCIDDSADLLRLLIKNGADVNVCDNDLWTPLHAAATCANLEICKILIENKAELLAVNTDGNMPYDICDDELCLEYIESEMALRGVTQQAIDMKRSETEMRMLDDLKQICMTTNSFSSSVSQSNQNSFNSLQNFTNYFTDAVCSDGRLNLNAKDNNGATLMHVACANGYTSILEFLLIDCQLAVESGSPLIGPSISVTDNDGWTALHVATFWGHQKAIEILLEHGADIDLKTNNDECVLDLCDDPDIRDFIIQKTKEIQSQQEQAAALAAMQKQMQLINNINNSTNYQQPNKNQNLSNNSSTSGSINRKPLTDTVNSSNSIANNSTRSLKRTSTGVSRSSSVRRSSFREREKASRKLDTSFKDVLYAQNNQIDVDNTQMSQSKNSSVVKIISNKGISGENSPVIKQREQNNQLNNTSPKSNKNVFVDDHNNNKLKIKNTHQENNFDASKNGSSDQPMARVLVSDGSASIYSQNNNNNTNVNPQIPAITLNNGTNPINQSTMSSNFSMSSSLVSSTISNNQNASSSLSQTPNPQLMTESLQSGNTISASSIAIIDMNHLPPKVDFSGLPTNNPNTQYLTSQTVQPSFNTDFLGVVGDGVKYKFVSNETIGAKSAMNNEFCDLDSEDETSKFKMCSKCVKCCHVM